ncbi:MAG TPA: hypothetical protein VGI11_04875 [Variovorax sp.]
MSRQYRDGLILVGLGCFAAAVLGWTWQLYWLAKGGALPPWSVIDALGWFFPQWAWLAQPSDWVGLHALFGWLNAGGFLVITGFLFMQMAA